MPVTFSFSNQTTTWPCNSYPALFFFRMTKSLQIKSWIFHIRIKRKEKSGMDLPSFILPKLTSIKWTKFSLLFIHPLNWKNTTLFSLIVSINYLWLLPSKDTFCRLAQIRHFNSLDTVNNRLPIGASFKKKKKSFLMSLSKCFSS